VWVWHSIMYASFNYLIIWCSYFKGIYFFEHIRNLISILHWFDFSKSEYVIFKLKEMGKIQDKDVMQICDQFRKLDPSNCGKITLPHLLEGRSWQNFFKLNCFSAKGSGKGISIVQKNLQNVHELWEKDFVQKLELLELELRMLLEDG